MRSIKIKCFEFMARKRTSSLLSVKPLSILAWNEGIKDLVMQTKGRRVLEIRGVGDLYELVRDPHRWWRFWKDNNRPMRFRSLSLDWVGRYFLGEDEYNYVSLIGFLVLLWSRSCIHCVTICVLKLWGSRLSEITLKYWQQF